jgi:hypothetical protein
MQTLYAPLWNFVETIASYSAALVQILQFLYHGDETPLKDEGWVVSSISWAARMSLPRGAKFIALTPVHPTGHARLFALFF